MLTLVGEDRSGIVAAVTRALFEQGMNLGETSMLRLGGSFTIMMMVTGGQRAGDVESAVREVADRLGLHVHIDPISGGLHRHLVPNIQVVVSGADRAGIVADVTGTLAEAGFNILDLESDVAGTEEQPVYIMQIAGVADVELEALEQSLAPLRDGGVDVRVTPIETLIG